VTLVYREISVRSRLADGRIVDALCYVADRGHAQYAGKLDRPELVRLVAQGEGISGKNTDYVRSTHAHLVELEIRDTMLEWLAHCLT